MLTNDNLLIEKPHPLGGTQRLYKFANGKGLSVINGRELHSYPFAWEVAVVNGIKDDGSFTDIDYTSNLTEDIEVFASDDETNAFISKAKEMFDVAI